MADIRDEHGRPIQLTDELGRPVTLTDEHGDPIHLTGVATTHGHGHGQSHPTIGSELHNKTTHDQTTPYSTAGAKSHGGTHFDPTPVDYLKHGAGAVAGAGAATVGAAAGAAKGVATGVAAPFSHSQAHGAGGDGKDLQQSTNSASSALEDDGQGGRRKKEGLMQKIKDKLPGHSDKEKQETAHSVDTKVGSTGGVPVGTRVEYHEQEHEKKGFMDKIKEKLPGHHSS